MGRCGRALATSALLALAVAADAGGAAAFRTPERVLDGKRPIDVDLGHAAPEVVDWDGDGRRDLLVGQYGDGKVRLYLNSGTDEEPRFAGYAYLRSGTDDLKVPYG